jgi:hypothetical protein
MPTAGPWIDPRRGPAFYSLSDSYDYQFRPNSNPQLSGQNAELHYLLKWTRGTAGITDNRRQLVYKEPPDDTVITWCLYHARMDAAGNPGKGEVAPVCFLSGRVQMIPAEKLATPAGTGGWPGTDGKFPWEVAAKP